MRQQAETILAQTPGLLDSMNPEEVKAVVHELRVHQIELELQNEELRRIQSQLEKTQNRYMQLYNSAPVRISGFEPCGRHCPLQPDLYGHGPNK